jgi:hypothetical protein
MAMGVANDNARAAIDRAGVGTGVSFDVAWASAGLYPAYRIPRYVTVIARGAEFMAYRVHSNPKAMQGGVECGHDTACVRPIAQGGGMQVDISKNGTVGGTGLVAEWQNTTPSEVV